MELSSFDIPNPYGLLAADFGHNMDSYGIALRFLGDVATGSTEQEALRANGGTPGMLVAWEGIQKLRRALGNCRQAGHAEREYAERKRKQGDPFRAPGNRLDSQYDPFRVRR